MSRYDAHNTAETARILNDPDLMSRETAELWYDLSGGPGADVTELDDTLLALRYRALEALVVYTELDLL